MANRFQRLLLAAIALGGATLSPWAPAMAAPTLTAGVTASFVLVSKAGPVVLDPSLAIVSTTPTLASATVSIGKGFVNGDILSTNAAGTAISASYNSAKGILTLTGTDTVADYRAVLRMVTFTPHTGQTLSSNTSRTLTWQADDGTAKSNAATSSLEITAGGDVAEFAIPSERTASGITAGPDGALWFAENPYDIGRITTAGAVTEFNTSSSNVIFAITSGPDGNLWFSEDGPVITGEIGKLTTSGGDTEFSLSHTVPFGIVADDGALWFAAQAISLNTFACTGEIGRISTTGAVSYFTIPGNGLPSSIATGSDGALWFVETTAGNSNLCGNAQNAIGRVTTSGAFKIFPISSGHVPTASNYSIASGSDGSLWFAETSANGANGYVGKITTAGAISEFAIPSGNVPFSIAAGPENSVWFSELANLIGRATTAGVIGEIGLPNALGGAGPGIAAGSDRLLWFTEPSRAKIGRLSPPRTLEVTPAAEISASGTQGGPFSPLVASYKLSANSGSVTYSITNIPAWLTASSTSGTLTTSPTTVTFTVNSSANGLAPKTYLDTIKFNNTVNNLGDATRTATLNVYAKQYTVTVEASPAADGAVSGGGVFARGSSRTVKATAKSGYQFVDWTEAGKVVSTSASYTFAVETNVTLVAVFSQLLQ